MHICYSKAECCVRPALDSKHDGLANADLVESSKRQTTLLPYYSDLAVGKWKHGRKRHILANSRRCRKIANSQALDKYLWNIFCEILMYFLYTECFCSGETITRSLGARTPNTCLLGHSRDLYEIVKNVICNALTLWTQSSVTSLWP